MGAFNILTSAAKVVTKQPRQSGKLLLLACAGVSALFAVARRKKTDKAETEHSPSEKDSGRGK